MGCEGSKPTRASPPPKPALQADLASPPSPDTVSCLTAASDEVEEGQAAEFKVVPLVRGRLLLHPFPSRKAVARLQDAGCDVVFTLQKDEEGAQKVRALCRRAGLRWTQFDFWKAYHGGDDKALLEAVRGAVAELRAGGNVVLHCAAGIHRTGMFAYGVLRELGLAPQAAAHSLHALRETTHQRVGAHRVYGMEDLMAQHWPCYTQRMNEVDFPPVTDKPLPPLENLAVRCCKVESSACR
eukprot:TRINITY_DN3410_c0_g1_i1.p1 TRINITY_DN3410_c0_g1~~TRINITY_DN3410_c0_g1_i1.p1  ORF type:complete len:240 (+),score=71.14 TRINITY_DN3410_c0_g1_i1:139-858(+)